MTLPSVAIQTHLTFTAVRINQAPTVTFTNGATAGSEVVTLAAGYTNITVQIESGVTTMAQVKAAVEAHVSTNGSLNASQVVTVTIAGGHTADTVLTCVGAALAGGAVAAKASKNVGPINILAAATGTGGNSTTLQLIGTTALIIGTVVDGTHLTITSNALMIVGATVVQGAASTTITTVTDATHIIVADTTGFTAAAATTRVTAGAEKVKVTSSAVLVQIQDGVSTWNQLRAIVAATGAAAALMVISSTGRALNQAITVALSGLSSAVTLTGGLAAAAATLTNQLVVVTADATGVATNGATLTFTTGATAGSEVVTMSGNNISVQIEDGVSTVTQIRTALNADAAFDAIYAATGTSAATPRTVNAKAMTGAVASTAGSLGFYADNTTITTTTSYQYLPMGNFMGSMSIYNDETSGTKTLIYSWDGINNHGSLLPTQSVELSDVNKSGIYLKEANGAPAFRAFAVSH